MRLSSSIAVAASAGVVAVEAELRGMTKALEEQVSIEKWSILNAVAKDTVFMIVIRFETE